MFVRSVFDLFSSEIESELSTSFEKFLVLVRYIGNNCVQNVEDDPYQNLLDAELDFTENLVLKQLGRWMIIREFIE